MKLVPDEQLVELVELETDDPVMGRRADELVQERYAFSRAAMSSLTIFRSASVTRFAQAFITG